MAWPRRRRTKWQRLGAARARGGTRKAEPTARRWQRVRFRGQGMAGLGWLGARSRAEMVEGARMWAWPGVRTGRTGARPSDPGHAASAMSRCGRGHDATAVRGRTRPGKGEASARRERDATAMCAPLARSWRGPKARAVRQGRAWPAHGRAVAMSVEWPGQWVRCAVVCSCLRRRGLLQDTHKGRGSWLPSADPTAARGTTARGGDETERRAHRLGPTAMRLGAAERRSKGESVRCCAEPRR